jgi:hypothetical protein
MICCDFSSTDVVGAGDCAKSRDMISRRIILDRIYKISRDLQDEILFILQILSIIFLIELGFIPVRRFHDHFAVFNIDFEARRRLP